LRVEPVKRENLPETIANQLRAQILRGELRSGDQLPGHRELAARFSVSVGSVREAISMLVSGGLVETRAGRGTFVAATRELPVARTSGHPLERKEAEELIEAREVIELQIVAMAAERASGEQIARLREAVARMQAAATTAGAYPDADVEFHLALAEAAGNRFLLRAMMDIRALLHRDMALSAEAAIQRFGTLQFSVDSHARLVEAIETGDAAASRDVMSAIMDRHHGFVLGLYALAGPDVAHDAGPVPDPGGDDMAASGLSS
jgi:GntR family transcriptional regulator, transcriptional repressor for pyruvate dehydrogenase complex